MAKTATTTAMNAQTVYADGGATAHHGKWLGVNSGDTNWP